MAKLSPPSTKTVRATDKLHGLTIQDPYRWLEEGNAPEVQRWVEGQNRYTNALLTAHADRKKIKKELLKYLKIDWVSAPVVRKGLYFWTERKGTQNQPILYYREGKRRKKHILVDPNRLNKEGTTSPDYWFPSPSGRFVAYGLSEGGTEHATLHIVRTRTRQHLGETIPHARYSTVGWLPDEHAFYYTRHPAPGTVPRGEELYHEKVYFHRLGSNPDDDPLVFGQSFPKEDMIEVGDHVDRGYVAIIVIKDWAKNDVYLFDDKRKKTIPVVLGQDAKFYPLLHRGKLYLMTNYRAPNYRIIAAPLERLPTSLDDWELIVPEGKILLEQYLLVSDSLITVYLENVASRLKIFDLQGREKTEVTLPTLGSIVGLSGEHEGQEFFYSFESFVIPSTIYRFDLARHRDQLFQTVRKPFNPASFTIIQVWYRSKDGTRVPMFIFHKKGVKRDGGNPCVLYGYGGFADSETPIFFKNWLPFLSRGGTMAVANIRGGGEFGERWHREGMLDKKQNSFDDFIRAAEYLIEHKYTNSRKLAILGGSNGGLLVAACMVQRPDLYRAVISMVPLLDMVRFPKFLMAARWVFEYGNPEKSKDLRTILRWSPYHNVNKGKEYPAVLFTTANKDFRVDPMHARKMCALLQSINRKNPVLLRTEMEAGHGPGKPLSKIANEQTDKLAFVYWQLGMS